MRRTVLGILAHVDAGKTTLSEALLYCSGAIRSLGRVDHGNAFLDNFALERERGITIFAKQAKLSLDGVQATLLDTPGHVDFSAEMERTLDVLDAALLVVSGPAGVQSHTRTVWRLLRQHNIPTLVFVNKMDLPGAEREAVLNDLVKELGDGFFDYRTPDYENIATCDEALLEEFLESDGLTKKSVCDSVARGKIFPCWFGAALKLDGVENFMSDLAECVPCCDDRGKFGAKVFKISRDDQGTRLTHLKVTGGALRVRDVMNINGREEKVSQIRIYSGSKYTPADEILPGDIAAVTGLTATTPGMGIGAEKQGFTPSLEPVLTYTLLIPDGFDAHKAYLQFLELADEDPQLHLVWDELKQQIRVQLMGPVQLEILRQVIADRFKMDVSFGPGEILYRETIASPVEGVGHYEPLRHYSEVHLLLEPGQPGSGIEIGTACSQDMLDGNWQRLILTHLAEKQHLGVLTGSPITDMKITLASGRSHEKHTEGGDFREATYRAVRQGLMHAECILLEPWYAFIIDLPQTNLGRAINDLQRMGADFEAETREADRTMITGRAPVSAMREYPTEIAAYTHGLGRFSCVLDGYAPCRGQDAVVEAIGYDPEADVANSPDSVFCSHGAGHIVKWYDVPAHMHLPSCMDEPKQELTIEEQAARYIERVATDNELMAIFERTYGPVKDKRNAMHPPKKESSSSSKPWKGSPRKDGVEYVLVDGYNIIFAWDDLRKASESSLDAARALLIERLRNYQGFRQCPVIVVFDAYKVKGNHGSVEHFGDLSVVYTKEAETADMYIEKAAYDLSKKHNVRVATSDGMEQMIILGNGALRVPARAFEAEVREIESTIRQVLDSFAGR